jgi:hypothetical protein
MSEPEPLFVCPKVRDRFGVVFPDGMLHDCTEGAWLFDQDAETRARMIAPKVGGHPVRIVTELVAL